MTGYRESVTQPRHTVLAALALGSIAALTLGACSAGGPDSDDTPTASSVTIPSTVPDGAEGVYSQQVNWADCDDLECATIAVPLDWSDPGGDTIDIAINRHAAGGDKLGSLLINPGGPGGSGLDALSSIALGRFGTDVVANYDLIGFDPRGVGQSTAISCVSDAQMDDLVSADYGFDTAEGIAQAEQAYTGLGEGCLDGTGPLLEHVDTVSAARDMDVIRAVLGDETLTYVGYSYGTQLGATYAALFPEQVGRLVLDGAVDPTLTSQELSLGQAVGFENALRAYVADCQSGSSCPLTGTVDDGMAQIRGLLDQATAEPLTTQTSDRKLTGALAFSGIALPLYDQQSWPYLTQGLKGAIRSDDGTVLLQLADLYYDRDASGHYSTNSTVAFWAIGCADDRGTTDVNQMRADAAEIEAAAPTVGSFFGYGGILCGNWPVPEAGGLDSYATDSAPILVIGTTNDPATPYAWSEKLTETLGSATLLTYEGEGHTAYGRSNSCIENAVDSYLIDGTVPADGTRC